MEKSFFKWLMGKVHEDTPTGAFAIQVIGTLRQIEVWGDGAGTYRAVRGFNQYCRSRESAWWYLRRKHPSLLPAFEVAADEYAAEIDPSWRKTRDYKLTDFYL